MREAAWGLSVSGQRVVEVVGYAKGVARIPSGGVGVDCVSEGDG